MARTEVVPAVNQIEVHPFFTQRELRAVHARLGIATQAWSPLGGITVYRPADPNAVKNALKHPVVTTLAAKYGKTSAQVLLRWHIEHGVSAIPKSVHARADRGELRRLRLRAHGGRGRVHRRARHGRARWARPGGHRHDGVYPNDPGLSGIMNSGTHGMGRKIFVIDAAQMQAQVDAAVARH